MKDGLGNSRWVMANVVDVLGSGCGLALMTLLKSGSTVVVRGKLGDNRAADQLKAGVRWCVANNDGTFRAGLEFLEGRSILERDEEEAALDCYEVMQLSPHADADTISRVYRMLAFRYHPDNAETGNSEMFIRLSEAHQILSDPEKRAGYDAGHRGGQRHRAKSPDRSSSVSGSEWRQRRNVEIVTAAYLDVPSLGYTLCCEG
jgi:DnaJ domain/PilZ domain